MSYIFQLSAQYSWSQLPVLWPHPFGIFDLFPNGLHSLIVFELYQAPDSINYYFWAAKLILYENILQPPDKQYLTSPEKEGYIVMSDLRKNTIKL